MQVNHVTKLSESGFWSPCESWPICFSWKQHFLMVWWFCYSWYHNSKLHLFVFVKHQYGMGGRKKNPLCQYSEHSLQLNLSSFPCTIASAIFELALLLFIVSYAHGCLSPPSSLLLLIYNEHQFNAKDQAPGASVIFWPLSVSLFKSSEKLFSRDNELFCRSQFSFWNAGLRHHRTNPLVALSLKTH